MHIEPGLVDGTKIVLSYATAAASLGLAAKMAADSIRHNGGLSAFVLRSVVATILVFSFFELLPHYPVGVSEVHLILGSTLFLILGAGPAAVGLALGLLLQGVFFAPFDLPQYGMNLTTLLVPLYGVSLLAKRIIPENVPYVDLRYREVLALSAAYQAGIVAWVAFWAFYGQGFTAENMGNVLSFGGAYMLVILAEPLIDLAVLAAAKTFRQIKLAGLVQQRVYSAAN